MQFGYFDDEKREYVITNPATPKSWSNYLGSTEYGAIITNNAGGYSFYKSGGLGRFIRMRFNSIPMDQPGKYLYLRDMESGDYWSASWQPVGKPLEKYKSVCRHGLAYTEIQSDYSAIASEITYFVPLDSNFEIWKVRITNNDKKSRRLAAFTYVEYASNWKAIDDLLNIQYVHYITEMTVIDGIINHGTNVNIPDFPDNFDEKDQGRHTFQAFVGVPVIGYETDRETFLGPYRSYSNPIAVEKGRCADSLAYGDNPCGCLQTEFELKAGETKEFLVLIGIGRADTNGRRLVQQFSEIRKAQDELDRLKHFWKRKLLAMQAITPDEELNSTINTWGLYNNLITFSWSRAASLIYTGVDRDGLGYRDTVQDFMGVTHAITGEVKERLEMMITGQVSTGGAMPVVLPTSHTPGREKAPEKDDYRSDDTLWLFNAIPEYVKESGDIDFYHKVLPYADEGKDSVYMHMKRAINFSLERLGTHGFPLGLRADWNDCLRLGYHGESIMVAMQLRYALATYIEVAELLHESMEQEWAVQCLQDLDLNIHRYAWDGEWFMRGYHDNGMKFGSKDVPEGQIYLNPQVWAIMSGVATPGQAASAMEKVHERLATDYGIMLCDPPYTDTDYTIVKAQLFNRGLKENGGIFLHTQGWAVIAEAMLGNGHRAYEYLRAYLPAAQNKMADIREIEPYVLSQSTHTPYSPRHGASRIPWLTGSATWTYYAITHYILGIRPEYEGLQIDPCIPENWKGFSVTRKFRGCNLNIVVKNEHGVQKGVKYIVLNGKQLNGGFVPFSEMKEENEVLVVM
ncbi:N,N'-diacetylchitobiose phosphorylase [candidate division KSB1 bacterium]|nr:N,N'-diacetylchitobiose phosphorylase [candidate division KSB1 bacterium]